MTVRVLALKSGDTTTESHRLGLSLFMQPAGGTLDRRQGIVPSPGAADLVGVSAMQAQVTPFVAWVDGTAQSGQAGYPLVLDVDAILDFDPGEPAVARVDRVIARVYDNTYDGSGQTVGSVDYLKGQSSGAASPLPASSLLLWEVTVPAGASAGSGGITFSTARTDKRVYASALGGIVVIKDAADRGTLTPYEGLAIWRVDRQTLEIHSGGQWRSPLIVSATGAANRDALVPNPRTGQLVHRSDFKGYETYNGSAWVTAMEPEQRIKTGFNSDAGTTTSTSYVETLTDAVGFPLTTNFTAPASGSVLVILSAEMHAETAGTNVQMSANVRQNSVMFQAANDSQKIWSSGFYWVTCATAYPVTGLTPGAACSVTPAFRSSSSSVSGYFDNVRVTVIPV